MELIDTVSVLPILSSHVITELSIKPFYEHNFLNIRQSHKEK